MTLVLGWHRSEPLPPLGAFVYFVLYNLKMNPIKNAFSNIAWKRTLIICAALGALGTVGASKRFDNSAQSIGYYIGYTGSIVVMLSSATAACSKLRKI